MSAVKITEWEPISYHRAIEIANLAGATVFPHLGYRIAHLDDGGQSLFADDAPCFPVAFLHPKYGWTANAIPDA